MSSKDFLPYDVKRGASVSGDELQENFNALTNKYPLVPEDIEAAESSTFVWNQPAPPSAYPQSLNDPDGNPDDDGGDLTIIQHRISYNDLLSDPLYVNALDMDFQPQYVKDPLAEISTPALQNLHFPAGCVWNGRRAFVVTDRNNDRVIIFTTDYDGTNRVNLLASYDVGSNPSHAVSLKNGDIWVFCDEPSVWRISPLGAAEVLSKTTLEGTFGCYGFRRAAANAFGTYLYAIAKSGSASGFYDRILRVSLFTPTTESATGTKAFDLQFTAADPPVAGSTGAGTEIADLVVYYPDGRATYNSTCHIAALAEQSGGTTATLWMFHGDDGTNGVSWPRTFTSGYDDDVAYLSNPTGQANEAGVSIAQWGTHLMVLCSYTSGADTSWAIVNYDQAVRESGGAITNGFSTLYQGTDTARGPMTGSLCCPPGNAVWIADDGKVEVLSRDWNTLTEISPIASIPGSPEVGSGVCYNGLSIYINWAVSASAGKSLVHGVF